MQSQRRGLFGQPRADVSQADDPQRLALDAPQRGSGLQLVLAVLSLLVIEGHFARLGQQQRQGVFGHFDQAVVGNVGDKDLAPRGLGDVDVVQANAQPRNDLALRRRADHLGRHLGPVGHDGVGIGGQGRQRVDILPRRDDQFGVDLGQRAPLDVQVGPGVVGKQNFVARHQAGRQWSMGTTDSPVGPHPSTALAAR